MKPLDVNVRMYDVGHGDCFLLSFRYQRESRHLLIDFGTRQPSRTDERARLIPIARNIATQCKGKLHGIIATHRHRDHLGGFEQLKKAIAPGNIMASLKPEVLIEPRMSPQTQKLLQISGALHGQPIPSLCTLGKLTRVSVSVPTGLERIIPGFRFHVLGPHISGAREWSGIRDTVDDETWNLLRIAQTEFSTVNKRAAILFPRAQQWPPHLAPPQMRWFINRISKLRDEQVQRLTQAINTVINNTSVILLIEGLGHKMLFPGDAELDAWMPVLSNAKTRALLDGITLYKASHHGSRNGTPRSLLRKFHPAGYASLLSTRDAGNSLINRLSLDSRLFDTRALRSSRDLFVDIRLLPGGGIAEAHPTLKAA